MYFQFGIIILLGAYQLMKFVPYLYPNSSMTDPDTPLSPGVYSDIRLAFNTVNGKHIVWIKQPRSGSSHRPFNV